MKKVKIYRTVHMKDDNIMYGDYHFDKELVELHAKALSNLSDYYHYIKDIRIEEADLISYSDDEEIELTPAERELNIIKKDEIRNY
jgi:hypothetical protein